MNAGGQLAGLNFPNWPGFAGQVLSEGPDPDINLIMIKAYNDWHVDEWCGAHPERFIPCGVLPQWDAEEAAREVRRLASKGCHAVTFTETGRAGLHDDFWDPFFAVCQELGTVVCAHLGSAGRGVPTDPKAPPSLLMHISPIMTMSTMADFLWSPTFRRFPDLMLSLTEGDIGWIPYYIQKAEHTLTHHGGWSKHEFAPYSGPEEMFRKNFLICFINDRVGMENLAHFNIDNVCWESDYPHSDGTWPEAPEVLEKCVEGLTDEVVKQITHLNAMRHYQFDPFKIRPAEKCTVAALRAESPDVDVVTHVGRPADERDRRWWSHLGTEASPLQPAQSGSD
jgi:predicted TIM-barrel fold metal-dependent hydrolase